MIYHVVTEQRWQEALNEGSYAADSLAAEGFIHASSNGEQVAGVLKRYYQQQQHLLLLHIDETKLTAPLKYEQAPSVNELFPHIYGRLNITAVVEVSPI